MKHSNVWTVLLCIVINCSMVASDLLVGYGAQEQRVDWRKAFVRAYPKKLCPILKAENHKAFLKELRRLSRAVQQGYKIQDYNDLDEAFHIVITTYTCDENRQDRYCVEGGLNKKGGLIPIVIFFKRCNVNCYAHNPQFIPYSAACGMMSVKEDPGSLKWYFEEIAKTCSRSAAAAPAKLVTNSARGSSWLLTTAGVGAAIGIGGLVWWLKHNQSPE